MNTIGVLVSACCLLVALIELRIRGDWKGRRMAAVLATAAWLTMALVAYDLHQQCEAKIQKTSAISTAQIGG